MYFSVRRIAILLSVTMLAIIAAAQSADQLAEEFDALASYDFGMSRAPLQRISEAVRAAAAGHPDAPHTTQEIEARLAAMLPKDISPEAKRFLCNLLGEIGGARTVEALTKALDDDALFNTALVALEQNPDDNAAAALAGVMENVAVEKRIAVIAALGRQGNPNAVDALIEALGDSTPAIAAAAAQALADIAQPAACRAVMNKTASATQETWLMLADACLRCADVLRGEDIIGVMAMLERLCRPEFPAHIRIAAVDGLMRCHPERTQELLMEALQDDNAALAHGALMLARANPAAGVVAALTTLLEQAAAARKPALLSILSDFGDVAALPDVLRLADHDQPEVRQAALRAVAVLGNADQTEFLLARATSGPMNEQRVAREALMRLADPATNAKLLAVATGRGDEAVRVRAITTLAERRAEDAAPALLALAARATPAVREESVRALRTLAPPEMLPDLLGLAKARDLEPIREVLPQTLAQTAARIPEPEGRADTVIAALNAASDTATRILLLETLGLIGGERAFEAVRRYPEATNAEIRRAVVTTLSRFQLPEALGELRGIMLAERDEGIRALAWSGYVSALRNAAQLPLRDTAPHIQTAYEQAKNEAERREFLAAAAQLPSPLTLRIVTEMTEGGDAAAEALRAMLQISVALAGAYPVEARQRLEQIIADENTPEPMREEARQATAFMERFEGHIMAYAVAGPYYETNVSADTLFSREFPPEVDADNANWRILKTLPDANPPYALELDRVLGGDDRVVFLRTTITAPEAREAILELGTNDGCRVWWNGALIHALNVGRALVPGEDKLPVRLAAGDNELMIAVFQHGAAWRATARLVGEDGQPVPDLVCRPALDE